MGSENGFSDAVRICGGGMMGMMDPVGLSCDPEDERLLRRRCRLWRKKVINPTRTDPAKTTARINIPVIKDLDTPPALPVTPLDDAAFAVPVVEDGVGCWSTGIVVAGSSVDLENPVSVLVALLEVDDVDVAHGLLLDV